MVLKISEMRENHLFVSIIIPCRNEKGNIEQAVKRCPELGTKTEIIFIEGHSKDGTYEEIERVSKLYPEKNIKFAKMQNFIQIIKSNIHKRQNFTEIIQK